MTHDHALVEIQARLTATEQGAGTIAYTPQDPSFDTNTAA
jgi:hypothetical protein